MTKFNAGLIADLLFQEYGIYGQQRRDLFDEVESLVLEDKFNDAEELVKKSKYNFM